MQPYSPERRTALVLCGSGAHGAYHAGVLRALQEAGVKIDVMAGQGVGAAGAALAAIDGASRLWEADGVWRGHRARTFYGWKWPLRAAAWLFALLTATLAAAAVLIPLGLVDNSARFLLGALIVLAALVLVIAAGASGGSRRSLARRRGEGGWWWRVFGTPLDTDAARDAFGETIWQLIRGATHLARPEAPALGRRYAEVLLENLGQPGFRELMLIATDLDSRRDVVAALLKEPHRREFVAPRPERERQSEVLDLAGTGREHAFDIVAAALVPPVAGDPCMLTFPSDGYWRGETHRLCDRPGAVSRLLEELAAAGVSQAIVISAVAAPPAPHRLTALRLEARQRLGEFLAAAESAALRDAIEMARLRFDSVYLIRPSHNPVGPFDVSGAYDGASDRRQDLTELMQGAYEDAYRQFIDPVVGGSGEHLGEGRSHKAEVTSHNLEDAKPTL